MRHTVKIASFIFAFGLVASACPDKAPEKLEEITWAEIPVGSTYEYDVQMTNEEGGAKKEVKATLRRTLVSIDEKAGKVKIKEEQTVGERKPRPREVEEPITGGLANRSADDKVTLEGVEEIEVKAGKFTCRKAKVESKGSTGTAWLAKGVPVAVKFVMTNEKMKATMELTKIEKAEKK
jgi:hypothetical protein